VWAAAFDAAASEPAIAVKAILPIGPSAGSAIRIGTATFANGAANGRVQTARHDIAWELAFPPAARAVRREPWLAHRLRLPTHVAHANDDVGVSGWIAVDGRRHELHQAPAVQKHLWGTRRVEELAWVYCPRFVEDPAARLEATSVRLHRRLAGRIAAPPLTAVWARTGDGVIDRCGVPGVLGNHVATGGDFRLAVRSVSLTRTLEATAWCDPRSLAGYVYRDPAGWDVHVAQSDVASCILDLRERAHPFAAWSPPRRLTARHAALELHAPEPLPGVRYVAWDACD
jgi:hypothetical protein